MVAPDARAIVEGWIRAFNARDEARLRELLHPDFVEEYPQSGERIRGAHRALALLRRYPGGTGVIDEASLLVAGADEGWGISPTLTVVRLSGGGTSFSMASRSRYPDGTDWYVVSLIQLRDGLVWRATRFFAPLFPAPEWRADLVEPMASGSEVTERE